MSIDKIDVLGREDFIQKLISVVELLSDGKQGCCFGINGVWGSGKSFVLERFEKQLKDIQLEETADNKYFVFHYDCWKYDYYDEPAIAIISAMLEAADKEIKWFSEEVNDAFRLSWKTAKSTLAEIARELCKNKVGIDLVAVAEKTLEEHDKAKIDDFDLLYGFKRALEETRKNIQKIAEDKMVVIVVDELDRCLPEYSIKILERLHHIFTGLSNVIVIVSMDKRQLEHSIKGMYGAGTDVDAYLRKFISFKIDLDNGIAGQYIEKYESYTSMFDIDEKDKIVIERLFVALMDGVDIRTQERIFRKAEIIHRMILDEKNKKCSIMIFEIMYLIVAFKYRGTNLKWLLDIGKVYDTNAERILGEKGYKLLRDEDTLIHTSSYIDGKNVLEKSLMGETYFWMVSAFYSYEDGASGSFFYGKQAGEYVVLVRKFVDLINIIGCD